jgi:serine/threonine protein kinase
VYDELRRLAARHLARETPGQTLQATALVHEAFMRLVDDSHQKKWESRRLSVPKIIDFGIAKATEQQLTSMTVFTSFRHFIGTPQHMSPEQATLSGLDIDTRSDVYALGVLL